MKVCSWMLVAVVALSLVACGGDEAADTPENGGGGGGGGDGGSQDQPVVTVTPSAAFEKAKEAWASGSFTALYGMLSEETRAKVDALVTQARGLAKSAIEQGGAAAEMAKTAFKAKWGVAVDELMEMSAEDAGGAMIDYVAEDEVPGVFKPDSKIAEEKIDGDSAVLVVEKPNGKTTEVEMVKEGDTWVLVYDW